MILDCNGRPLRRLIGFVREYVAEAKALPLVDALSVVGFEVPAVGEDEEDEEEGDAARNRDRMRRG